ncbi:MAG: GtrA family protein [Bifidobacteriaceae bacterium]|nr:GtrA family protein [Bifidobacteriaceae bacterium]
MTSLAHRGPLASRAAFVLWLRELATFGAVGGVAYIVDAGGYNLLVYGPGHLMASSPVRASLVCGAVSILVAWLGNRYLTFAATRNKAKTKELIMFVLVNLVGIMIAAGCLYISRWILGYHSLFADNLSRNIIGVGLGTIFRYLCYKFIIFKAR